MMEAMAHIVFHDPLHWSKLAMISKASTTGDAMSLALSFFDRDLVMLPRSQPAPNGWGKRDGIVVVCDLESQ
jgi:hypothetical protein